MGPRHANSGSEAGAVLIEGCCCLGIFLLCLVSASDLLRISALALATQHAVQTTASWAALGEVTPGKSRVQTIADTLVRNAAQLGVTLTREQIRICPATEAPDCSAEDAGESRTDLSITVLEPVYSATLHQTLTLSFNALARNE